MPIVWRDDVFVLDFVPAAKKLETRGSESTFASIIDFTQVSTVWCVPWYLMLRH